MCAIPLSQKDAYRLMLKDYPDVMNIRQVCEVLGISVKTGYRLLQDEKIECLKVGRSYRIPKAHILIYLNVGQRADTDSTRISE